MSTSDIDVVGAVKQGVDVMAGATAVATIVQWLPPIAALLSIVWLSTRLYEYARYVRRGRKPEDTP